MFDAYSLSPVSSSFEKANFKITTITAIENTLFAGTSTGILLIFKKGSDVTGYASNEYQMQVVKSFTQSKKSVVQLEAVPSHNLLVSLSDGSVCCHDIHPDNVIFITSIVKFKGASLFAVESVKNCDHSFRIALVMRRRLYFLRWENKDFVQIPPFDLHFPDTVRALRWSGDGCVLAAAVRDEYYVVQFINDGSIQQTMLFTQGSRSNGPLIVLVDKRIGLCRDECTVVLGDNNKPDKNYPDILWSEPPLSICCDPPFLIGILGRSIEIRSIKPSYCVQTIDLASKSSMIAVDSSLRVYVASGNQIWQLNARNSIKMHIQHLVKERQYELAVQLAEKMLFLEDSGDQRKRVVEIKNKHAFHLFCERKFDEAFQIWTTIQTEALFVIGLFAGLLPPEIRATISYPEKPPEDLTAQEVRKGLLALSDFLTQIRARLSYRLKIQPHLKQRIVDVGIDNLSRDEQTCLIDAQQIQNDTTLMQIIDTTLLKCYLKTNEIMLAPLIRLKDNSCNIAEAEKALSEANKHYELFLLYERKHMHNKALDLLRLHAFKQNSSLSGIDRTIQYLQKLGTDHLSLIFEYSPWIFKENVAQGLSIFTDDCSEVRNLDRQQVVHFLSHQAPDALLPYLEHIIDEWDEERPHFHQTRVERYISVVKLELKKLIQSLPEGHNLPKAGSEPNPLGQIRTKLLKFLKTSLHYNPEFLLPQIGIDEMFEERAIILGRLKRHEQAIAIYTCVLLDFECALQYCKMHYDPTSIYDAQVYLHLIRMYARPPKIEDLGLSRRVLTTPKPNIGLALKVLKCFSCKVDTVQAVDLLSEGIRLDELWVAIEAVLKHSASTKRMVHINSGLVVAQRLRTLCSKQEAESPRLDIAYSSACKQCAKKISNSAFVRYPDGSLMHYFCYRQLNH